MMPMGLLRARMYSFAAAAGIAGLTGLLHASAGAGRQAADPNSPGVKAMVVWLSTGSSDPAVQAGIDTNKTLMAFVADRAIPVHKTPSQGAPIVWAMQPLDLAFVVKTQQGAAQIASQSRSGWVLIPSEATIASVIPRGVEDAAGAISDVEDKPWSIATKMAILGKKPQIGFTEAQVIAALGKALSTSEEQVATGTTTTMVYVDHLVTLVNGKVTKVTTVR
jgi:hypothetical protein